MVEAAVEWHMVQADCCSQAEVGPKMLTEQKALDSEHLPDMA
jgi:hypothetical protein